MANDYMNSRRRLSGFFYERALPNEYLVRVGQKSLKPVLGGKMFSLGRKFMRIPASVQKLQFETDNANQDYQGIGIEGYATWRINPEYPEVAISTLDFFDDADPMSRTNEDLTTICIEAVRHVIANMSIEDALKNKDAIAAQLKKQLKSVEDKWGILFDQVGIERVRIMSNKLFNDLQAEYRNKMRLSASKIKITTDREISKEENDNHETSELERLQTAQKVELREVEKDKKIQEKKIEHNREIKLKEHQFEEEDFKRELAFRIEKEQEEFRYKEQQHELDMKLLEKKAELMDSQIKLQEVENEIQKKKLDLLALERELEQRFSKEALEHQFVEKLPEIFKAMKIENYSVIDNGGQGSSPVSKMMQDVINLLRTNGILNQTNNDETV